MLLIILLVFAAVLLVLIIAGVPVSQKALNILFLILVILLILERTGWVNRIGV